MRQYIHLSKAVGTLLPVWCLWATIATAQPVTLEWKWEAGQSLTYEVSHDQRQRSMEGTNVIDISQQQIVTVRYETLRLATNDLATVAVTYDRVRFASREPGQGRFSYDSTQDPPSAAKNHPVATLLAGLAGRTFMIDCDRFGTIHRVAGFRAALSGAGMPPELADGMDEESIKAQLETSLRVVPIRPVEPGNTWAHMKHHLVPGAGYAQSLSTFALDSFVDVDGRRCAHITFHTDTRLSHSGSRDDAQELSPFVTAGSLYFDPDAGRLVRQSVSMDAEQVFELAAGPEAQTSNVVTQRLKQRITVDLREENEP